MKKVSLLIGITLFILLPTLHVHGEEKTSDSRDLTEGSKSAILMEQDTGEILMDRNIHEQLPPASMTKVMTLLLIMEELDKGNIKLNEKVRVSENASSMGGSQVFLEAGEEMSIENLIKGIAVASGNDASVAMAERIAGSEEAFVKKMNEKVKQLNLKDTKFKNSSGLPAKDHYSTAHDMAVISKELLKYENVTEYTSIYEDYLRKGTDNEFWLVNTNRLVKFYPGVDGLKTGFTNEAKYCLTATAKKDNMRVITVVMGAETPKERNKMVSNMLDYAFNHYQTEKLYDKGQTITELELLKSETSQVDIVTSQSVSILSKKGEEIDHVKSSYTIDDNIELPLEKGTQVGVLTLNDGEDVVSEIPLVTNEHIDRASYYTLFKRSLNKLAKYN
ncbi:D-alanyl-D-alanine carboxypeptidase [Virgibacillus sp. MSJ-26]|uniref:D-alanyl-D-alanine carboxypeptidase family protein n=1 Tax=Virgibacillus sp. MSJ-26 TaxID=2841522 RepID=UPI001C0F9C6D|nr:D-alanyl-D-alanine carboxypeptidase family protein [Virgibacillus sp. MSJ-26]MBU5466316.1 D-alanyl-D-alanine carboxypeptidase [Virgibacillus sp. MSJ-26]